MYQAARIVDARTGSKGRRSEKCVVGFHNHASARHAIPRHSLVNRIFAREALEDETVAYARARCGKRSDVGARSEALHQPARTQKRAAGWQSLIEVAADSEDFREATRSFLEKREPIFRGV